jgi:FAD/FMN-containing dehydrogenase
VTREKFLEEVIINFFHRLPSAEPLVTELGEPKNSRLNRIVFRGSAGSDYGKQLRWDAEKRLDPFLSGDNFERNALLYEPVALFQNHSKTSTDILMECFVPPSEFEPFLVEMRKIISKTHADLLNVTVRHVNRDTDSFLRYADKDMYSLVMLFDQSCDSQGESKMAEAAREIIAAVLKHDGRYYLPYRLHATPEQFAAAYPQAKDFFELKRKYDPDELFQNEFYRKYRN